MSDTDRLPRVQTNRDHSCPQKLTEESRKPRWRETERHTPDRGLGLEWVSLPGRNRACTVRPTDASARLPGYHLREWDEQG